MQRVCLFVCACVRASVRPSGLQTGPRRQAGPGQDIRCSGFGVKVSHPSFRCRIAIFNRKLSPSYVLQVNKKVSPQPAGDVGRMEGRAHAGGLRRPRRPGPALASPRCPPMQTLPKKSFGDPFLTRITTNILMGGPKVFISTPIPWPSHRSVSVTHARAHT